MDRSASNRRWRAARSMGRPICRRWLREGGWPATEGLDAVLDEYGLDALIAPTGGPAWPLDPRAGDTFLGGSSRCAAVAGYPLVTLPAGFVSHGEETGAGIGLPVGLTFMGRAWSELALIRLAYAFEQITQVRRPPEL